MAISCARARPPRARGSRARGRRLEERAHAGAGPGSTAPRCRLRRRGGGWGSGASPGERTASIARHAAARSAGAEPWARGKNVGPPSPRPGTRGSRPARARGSAVRRRCRWQAVLRACRAPPPTRSRSGGAPAAASPEKARSNRGHVGRQVRKAQRERRGQPTLAGRLPAEGEQALADRRFHRDLPRRVPPRVRVTAHEEQVEEEDGEAEAVVVRRADDAVEAPALELRRREEGHPPRRGTSSRRGSPGTSRSR